MRVLQNRLVVSIVSVLMILFVLGVGVRQWLHNEGYITIPQRFDPKKWADAGKIHDSDRVRLAMWKDLQRNHLRIGMTKVQVRALLGMEADDGTQIFSYEIGIELFTVHGLNLHFDSNDLLERWELWED